MERRTKARRAQKSAIKKVPFGKPANVPHGKPAINNCNHLRSLALTPCDTPPQAPLWYTRKDPYVWFSAPCSERERRTFYSSECFSLSYPQVPTKNKAKNLLKLINARVQKTFHGVVHYGYVKSFDATNGYYFVKYGDSDEEDFDIDELRECLIKAYCYPPKPGPP